MLDRIGVSRPSRLAAVLLIAALAVTACHSASSPRATASAHQPSAAPSSTHKVNKPPHKVSRLTALIAKLPHFGSPPAPVRVHLPTGTTAPIYFHLPVHAKVAFLTIDDGIDQRPGDLTVMRAAHVRFTMFLIAPVAARNPPFFRHLVADGGVIEDHTLTHPSLRGRSYDFQHHEICGARTSLTHTFGPAPTLFRPPFGNYDHHTLQVVHDCGLKAAFYWSETVRHGKVFYQTSVHRIRPGDIILMHFRSTFAEDVVAALTAIHRAGLTPALLESYIEPVAPAGT